MALSICDLLRGSLIAAVAMYGLHEEFSKKMVSHSRAQANDSQGNGKIPEKQGFFVLASEQEQVAERVGFEPTWGGYAPNRFRVGAVIATSVPLRAPYYTTVRGKESVNRSRRER